MAGVSIGTVDRVLHGRGRVSAETKAQIEAIVAALGYKPNLFARHLSLNRQYVVKVLLPHATQDSGYWGICRNGVEAGMEELASFGARVLIEEFDRYDTRAFKRMLERVHADPGDGLLMAPVLPEALHAFLDRLPPEIPYVFFDGTLPGANPFASIGQDALMAGHTAGRIMSLVAPDAPRLAAVSVHSEDRHIRNRIEGFKAFYEELAKTTGHSPRIDVWDLGALDDEVKFERSIERLFAEGPGIKGILATNASGHIVGEWLVRRGHKDSCALVAWDLVPDNEAGLRSGSIDCIISQKPFEQGRMGLSLILRKVMGAEVPPGRFDLPIEIWFKENLPYLTETAPRLAP